ncbi:MAG TPA: response regulator [Terriglobia bacterium]|nr:response regulator [Terriglobia bacterium]
MQILLVEDVRDNRELFRVMLEKLGHTVMEAEDGRQAVYAALAHRPDCILMDLSLPDVDGVLATAALRRIFPLRDTPIVAITAFPKDLARDKALAAGCNAYLEKPFSLEALSAVLHGFSQSS